MEKKKLKEGGNLDQTLGSNTCGSKQIHSIGVMNSLWLRIQDSVTEAFYMSQRQVD